MANGLMGLSNLLGQSSNAQSGGLIGGGVFSQPESRGQRRSRLLTEAISSAGQNPYARLGASFGGLIGMGGRAAAEGLGIVDEPPEVKRANAIRQVQEEVRQTGLDPMSNPAEFGELVSNRFQELGYPDLALRTQMQIRQMMPEAQEPEGLYGQYVAARRAGDIPESLSFQEFRQSGSGPQTSVTVEGDTTPPELTDAQQSVIENYSSTAETARGVEFDLYQAGEILSQEDVDTGRLQPLILNVQGIAEDLGIDFNEALANAGFEGVGDLASKEELDRVLNRVLINSFDKFKGNLNTREVNIAFDANSNIGRSKEANIRGIATQLAANELARERGSRAVNISSPSEFKNFQNEVQEAGTEKLIELRDKYEKQIREGRFGTAAGQPEATGGDEGAVDWSDL
jgi:hypothetical protein